MQNPAQFGYRPMLENDIDHVPIDCQGDRAAITARIADLGASAILVFDGAQHVGQLQFRRHAAELRSPNGIWHPDYWGDFPDSQPELPADAVGIFCYHVGQLESGEDRDSSYFGRGIGQGLLDYFLDWAEDQQISTIVAKHTPPSRAVMAFMGGQAASVYEARGFEVVSSWIDGQLLDTVRERGLADSTVANEDVAGVGMCVKHLA